MNPFLNINHPLGQMEHLRRQQEASYWASQQPTVSGGSGVPPTGFPPVSATNADGTPRKSIRFDPDVAIRHLAAISDPIERAAVMYRRYGTRFERRGGSILLPLFPPEAAPVYDYIRAHSDYPKGKYHCRWEWQGDREPTPWEEWDVYGWFVARARAAGVPLTARKRFWHYRHTRVFGREKRVDDGVVGYWRISSEVPSLASSSSGVAILADGRVAREYNGQIFANSGPSVTPWGLLDMADMLNLGDGAPSCYVEVSTD